MNYVISYAQNREDLILRGFFANDETGFYVDIGANDPDTDSVTKLFYESGWSGINVEPIRRLYEKIVTKRPRDINLNIGISKSGGKLEFREYSGSGLSTFSKTMQKQYEQTQAEHTTTSVSYEVETMPLRTVLTEYADKRQITFMKVDVEGYEYEVLSSNDWSRFKPLVLCIEANHVDKDWRPLIRKKGYTFEFFDGLNEYYVSEEYIKSGRRFSYVEAIIRHPIADLRVDAIIKRAQAEPARAQRAIARLEAEVNALNNHIEHLTHEINHSKRIRSSVKNLAFGLHGATLTYIEKLNKPKKKGARKVSGEPVLVPSVNDAISLSQQLRLYDTQSLYSTQSDTRTTYNVTRATYMNIARLLKRAGKATYRVMKRTR